MAPKKRARKTNSTRTAKLAEKDKEEHTAKDDSGTEDPHVQLDESGRSKRKTPVFKKIEKQNTIGEVTSPPKYCHWLMKSEPDSRFENGIDVKFGIEDLKALSKQIGCWDGVRNYQARNFMRDMKVGQMAFFYHSNCKEPGIAGIIKIVKEAYVDHTQFDQKDVHYDASSKPENPKWSMVDVQYERMMSRFLPLSELKKYHLQHKAKGGALKDMALFTRARLSVQPLTSEEFDFICNLENEELL